MSEKELKLLRAMLRNGGGIYAREVDRPTSQVVRLLTARGYVERVGALEDAVFRITEPGRAALADGLTSLRRQRRDSVRYWITTSISILALILSIIAFLQSTGRIDLSPERQRQSQAESSSATAASTRP